MSHRTPSEIRTYLMKVILVEGAEPSPLGEAVALFLERMWGLHNLSSKRLKRVDWATDHCLEFITDKPLSTIDNSDLTRLVVIAHQMMLRVELEGTGPGYVRLIFHQRTTRERINTWAEWCPYIEEHVARITTFYPAIEKVETVQEKGVLQ